MPPGHEFWEQCARDVYHRTARTVAYLPLCTSCTRTLEVECFNRRPPFARSGSFHGFCSLCNIYQKIHLWQWFMCQTCQNVVLSYGRSRAAAQYVDNFWLSAIKPVASNFSLFETDPVKIESYRAGASSMKAKAARALIGQLQQLDFRVEELGTGNVFLIELKTGPGNPKEMKDFQLDVNDVQDISTAMEILHLPAYVFHVQIENEYRGATRRPVARNLWWADVTTFLAAESSRAERRDERKQAIYFDPSVFQAKESFVEELLERRFEDSTRALKSGMHGAQARESIHQLGFL
jgi:hypothetical protein